MTSRRATLLSAMRAVACLAVSLPLACTTGPLEPPADAAWSGGCNSGSQPSGLSTITVFSEGSDRTLHIWRPQGYGSDYPYPVVFMLHGRGGNGMNLREFTNIEGKVDNLAIVVYPDALLGEDGVSAWTDADIPFFDAALAELGSTHCVDEARVFAAGFSNGGAFANGLACARPDSLRAIASVAGGGPGVECPAAVPALIAHGTHDATVAVEVGEASRDYWGRQAACGDAESPALDDAHCSSFQGCDVPVVWCQHDDRTNGGHWWPAFLDTAVWRFFSGV